LSSLNSPFKAALIEGVPIFFGVRLAIRFGLSGSFEMVAGGLYSAFLSSTIFSSGMFLPEKIGFNESLVELVSAIFFLGLAVLSE